MILHNLFLLLPAGVLITGAGMHIAGFFEFAEHGIPSLWVIWVHSSMTALDLAGLYGIIRKRRWGLYLGMFIFTGFSLVQGVLLVLHIKSPQETPFDPVNYATMTACFIAAFCLYKEKSSFRRRQTDLKRSATDL